MLDSVEKFQRRANLVLFHPPATFKSKFASEIPEFYSAPNSSRVLAQITLILNFNSEIMQLSAENKTETRKIMARKKFLL